MRFQGSAKIILSGFTIAMTPFLLLMIGAIVGMQHIRSDMEKISRHHHEHAELVYTLRMVARERVVTLYSMANSKGPFEADALREHYIALATEFLQARSRLDKIHMNPDEQHEFKYARQFLSQVGPLQDQVIDLIDASKKWEALDLIEDQVIPLQDQVFRHFQGMLKIQNTAMESALADAKQEGNLILWIFTLAGFTAVMLSLFSIRQSVKHSRKIENQLFTDKERAEVTLNSITDGVLSTDGSGIVDGMNMAAEHMIGWPLEWALGKPLREIYALFDITTGEKLSCVGCHEFIDDLNDKPYYLLKGFNGRELIIQDSIGEIYNREGEITGTVVVFRDVSHSWKLAGQVSWRASHDELTGLINRSELGNLLTILIEQTQLVGGHHVLLFLDLDRFKTVNDEGGHAAGDELLRQVATLLKKHGRAADYIARIGGDEFAILLKECPVEQGLRIAENIRSDIEAFRFPWQDQTFEIGVSIGLTAITEHSGGIESVMHQADEACSLAKQQGRNCVKVWLDNESIPEQDVLSWKAKLTCALEHDHFTLYFQKITPLLDVHGGKQHNEILLRYRNEQEVLSLPETFLSSAERCGLMPQVDRWVLQKLFQLLRKRLDRAGGLDTLCQGDHMFAINISAASLNETGFENSIVEMIKDAHIPPQILCFELPENAVITHLSRATIFIERLSSIGCRIALDDACGNMSSFNYYKNLPISYIKISRQIIRDSLHSPINRAALESVAQIAHMMAMQVVAKGVESEEILTIMHELGVDYAQGFALHEPEGIAMLA